MNNRTIKLQLIQELIDRPVYTRQVNDVEYQTRCPYCGDSERENTGHFYLRIDPDDNFPVVYNCFKCPASGVLSAETLSMLDITNVNLKSSVYTLNKTSDKLDNKNILDGEKDVQFDYVLPEVSYGKKIQYIEDRIGVSFNEEDFKRMKVITSLKEFLQVNEIETLMCSKRYAQMIENHYVGFLSYGASHILFRDITEKEKFPWLKYPITKKSRDNRIFYSMETVIDVFTRDKITINLSEGIMDILSACYNLGYNGENVLNISVTGKYYEKMLLYLIDMGFVGDNITVNIFSDNDAQFNRKKGYESTTIDYYKKRLKNYKYLYGDINVYYNQMRKDIGVPLDKISLKKYKI